MQLVMNNGETMEVVLKKPIPGDIGWLISTHGRLYAKQFGFDQQFELDIAQKVVEFHNNGEDFDRLFIARSGSERVGSIAISKKENNSSFINFLLVEERFRGKGIASLLLEKVLNYSYGHGVERVFLETYNCLEDARKLYRKYGFSIFKTNGGIQRYGHVFDEEFWQKAL